MEGGGLGRAREVVRERESERKKVGASDGVRCELWGLTSLVRRRRARASPAA